MTEKTVLSKGRFLNFVERDGWEYAERRNCSGIVMVLPVTADDELVLVEQYRIPVQSRVIELVAGLAGDAPEFSDEDLSAAARRELLEETGFEAETMEFLSAGPPSAGITNEILSLYQATGLTRVAQGGGDDSEDIDVHLIPLSDVRNWLQQQAENGCLVDSKIYAGLYFLGGRQPGR